MTMIMIHDEVRGCCVSEGRLVLHCKGLFEWFSSFSEEKDERDEGVRCLRRNTLTRKEARVDGEGHANPIVEVHMILMTVV